MSVNFAYIAAGIGYVLLLTALCFLTGALLALIFLVLRARNRVFAAAYRVFVDIVRSVPPLVWIFIVYFGLPEFGIKFSSFIAAYLSLSIIATAYLSEIFRGGYAGLEIGQVEASKALGLNPFDMLIRVICPQVFRVSLPATTSYTVGLLKDTSMASIIGVAEVTFRASNQTNLTGDALEAFGFAGALYIILSLLVAGLGRTLYRRSAPSSSRRRQRPAINVGA